MSNLYAFMMEKACGDTNKTKTIEIGGSIVKVNNICVAKNNEIVGIDGIVEYAAYPAGAIPSSGDTYNPDMFVNMHVVIYMQMMSIDMMLTDKEGGNVINKRSVVIGNTADDSSKKPMIDFVNGVCNMLHWEIDEKNVKAMTKNVIENGVKELMKKARYSIRK
mgnify:CR=1 FL=1|nr:MAG TPA: hypothetical protein [Caudoviricetes sp.]